MGDLVCVNGATTYEGVKDCATVAKAVLADDAEQELEAQRKKLEAQLREQNAKIERLLTQLSTTKDDAERAALQKQLEEEKEAQRRLKGAPARPTVSANPCKCQPSDPLCSCL